MLGSVSRLAIVEKSFCENLGSKLGFGFGAGFGRGREEGGSGGESEGHLTRGLPGTDSHDWLEKDRGERKRRLGLGFGLKKMSARERKWRGLCEGITTNYCETLTERAPNLFLQ